MWNIHEYTLEFKHSLMWPVPVKQKSLSYNNSLYLSDTFKRVYNFADYNTSPLPQPHDAFSVNSFHGG